MIDARGGESRVALKFVFSLCVWQVNSLLRLLPVKERQRFTIVKFYPRLLVVVRNKLEVPLGLNPDYWHL